MASELRVNSSTNRSGLGTITYTDSGPIVSGVGTFTNGLTVDGTQTTVKSLKLTGDNYNANWFKTSGIFRLNDNAKLNIGSADDMQQYHDGTTSYIKNTTGVLRIENTASNIGLYASHSSGDIIMRVGGATSSENAIVAVSHGEVTLGFNGATKLTTTNTGAVVSGILTATNLDIEGGSAALSQLKINSTGRYRGVQLDENGTRKAHFQHDATSNTTVVGTAEGTMQFNSGDTPRVVLNSSGHWVPYADSTYDLGLNATRWRNVYADTLYGDGSNLTGITQTTLTNVQNNRVMTAVSGTTLNAEANLEFDGSTLTVGGGGAFTGNIDLNSDTNKLKLGAGDDFQFWHNGSSNFIWTNSGPINIQSTQSSANGYISFTSGGTTERLRIRSDGKISAGTSLNASNSYEFSLTGADATGGFYAHGRNHYLSNRSNAYASLTLKKSNSDSDATDYFQLRDSSNYLKASITGAGNWKPISGGGIDFSSTGNGSGTMTSELLDDYEEGSWTPTVTSGASGITVSTATYTKVGRLVHVQCRYNSLSSPNGSQLIIGGLPYASTSTGHYTAAVMHDGWDFSGSTEPVATTYMSGGNSHFVFYYSRTNGNGWDSVSGSETNGNGAIFSFCYHTN